MKNAELAAMLLRESAAFMRDVGAQNPAMKPEMEEAAKKCDTAADLVEKDPTGDVNGG
ncbi:MAG: hypothetical protein ACO3MW_00840 [Rhodospirillales bacterium]|jgi:hypothetical protein